MRSYDSAIGIHSYRYSIPGWFYLQSEGGNNNAMDRHTVSAELISHRWKETARLNVTRQLILEMILEVVAFSSRTTRLGTWLALRNSGWVD